jgi:pimeloyl-ACP methyl ester carboxylesterase
MRRKWLWRSLISILLLLVIGATGFLVWANNPHQAMPVAFSSLESDSQVVVQTDPWLVFTPTGEEPFTGLIFYPGGLVDPQAYAPCARAVAASGYLVVIPSMPLNLAVFNPNAAADIIAAYPGVTNWAIGGHSLGGSMAAAYADQNPKVIAGLILWASYPAGNNDLSEADLAVTSIYGTLDGLATPEKVLAARPLLPADTTWVEIEGGNHAQFGWYGPQDGDNQATISREEQSSQIVAATVTLLSRLER